MIKFSIIKRIRLKNRFKAPSVHLTILNNNPKKQDKFTNTDPDMIGMLENLKWYILDKRSRSGKPFMTHEVEINKSINITDQSSVYRTNGDDSSPKVILHSSLDLENSSNSSKAKEAMKRRKIFTKNFLNPKQK